MLKHINLTLANAKTNSNNHQKYKVCSSVIPF